MNLTSSQHAGSWGGGSTKVLVHPLAPDEDDRLLARARLFHLPGMSRPASFIASNSRSTRQNVTLAHAAPAAGATRGEPSSTAQGVSDRMLVDALARGYADFRVRHGAAPMLSASPI